MTQEVQPLTWSKRTNIEEHQQFFSKINEIIGNLAPTVDEAEQAIAQATQAVTDANAAITTANAASAAADAAAQQAQTAADTVAGYNTRLIAVEDEAAGNTANITDLQGRMGTAEGKITALQGVQGDYVKKAGAAQTVTSQIMVPTTATGLRDTQIANGTRIQNDLAAYEQMVRTTGNQSMAGIKLGNFYTFVGEPVYSSSDPNMFTSLCNLGAADSAIAIGFCVVSRTNVCIGGITVTDAGVPTYQGIKVSTGSNLTLGIGEVDGNLHLLIKRNTTAGQNVSVTIFGITKSRSHIDPPAGGVGTVEAISYNEAVTI